MAGLAAHHPEVTHGSHDGLPLVQPGIAGDYITITNLTTKLYSKNYIPTTIKSSQLKSMQACLYAPHASLRTTSYRSVVRQRSQEVQPAHMSHMWDEWIVNVGANQTVH